jgi:hypothetical protein
MAKDPRYDAILDEIKELQLRNDEQQRENQRTLNVMERQQDEINRLRGVVRADVRSLEPYSGPTSDPKSTHVEKLNKSNYRLWETEIEMILKEMDSFEILFGNKKFSGTPNERDFTDKEKERVFRILFQACDSFHREIILDYRDPQQVWEKFASIYKPENLICRIRSVQDFFSIRMNQREDMHDYIKRLNHTYQGFLNAGNSPIEESLVTQIMLIGLSTEFDNVRSIVNTWKTDELTRKRLEEVLLSEWQQKTWRKDVGADYNMVSSSRVTWPKLSQRFTCYNCGKPGHKRDQCRVPQKLEDVPKESSVFTGSIKTPSNVSTES